MRQIPGCFLFPAGRSSASLIVARLGTVRLRALMTRPTACSNRDITMVRIDAFQPADFATVVAFVEAIQEHERIHVPDLKLGSEIGKPYTNLLLRSVAERNGC